MSEQWWNAENKFPAYYRCLRQHYDMPALEAFNYAKKAFIEYPEFFANPIGVIRAALDKDTTK